MAIMKTVEDTEKVTIPAADIADIRYIKINKDITRGSFFTEILVGSSLLLYKEQKKYVI